MRNMKYDSCSLSFLDESEEKILFHDFNERGDINIED